MKIININGYDSVLLEDAWQELFNKGFHPISGPIHLNDYENYAVFDNTNKEIGVVSFWVDDFTIKCDLVIQMIYVKPENRKKGVSRAIHEFLIGYCKLNNIGLISYAVNNKNKPMLAAQSKYKSCDKYTIFQYRV